MGIDRALKEAANQRGFGNEDRFFDAFQGNFSKPSWFIGIRKGSREDDANKIDAIVVTKDAGNILIQLKSSRTGLEEFRRKNPRRAEYIGVVVVNASDSPQKLRKNTFRVTGYLRDKFLMKRWRPGQNF